MYPIEHWICTFGMHSEHTCELSSYLREFLSHYNCKLACSPSIQPFLQVNVGASQFIFNLFRIIFTFSIFLFLST